jgi:hypothetical protein
VDTWLRIAIFAVILISFLRRIFKIKAQGRPPAPQSNFPQTVPQPRRGKKNDFRDVPPPPENPELG